MPIIPHGQLPEKVRDILMATLSDFASGSTPWDEVGSEVFIISPWIRDVPLPPIGDSPFASEVPTNLIPDENYLSDVVSSLIRVGARVRVITLPRKRFETDLGKSAQELQNEAPLLRTLVNMGCAVQTLEGIHAKIIATKRGSIFGSANLTYRGVYKNKELSFLLLTLPSDINNDGLVATFPDLLHETKQWAPPGAY